MFIISYLVFMAENWKDLSFIEIEERELCIDLIEVQESRSWRNTYSSYGCVLVCRWVLQG